MADLKDLRTYRFAVHMETGKQTNGTTECDELLIVGVGSFNAAAVQTFELSAEVENGPALILDREPTPLEQRALILWAVVVFLDNKSVEESTNAIKVRNSGGATDLTGVEFALAKRRKELKEQQLDPLMRRITDGGVASEVSSTNLGACLP